MRCEAISITVPGADGSASLAAYLPDNLPELGWDRRRPAVIVCPGGGYHRLSDREGEPVALRFLGLGCAAFVLYYHVAPQGRWPVPQRQLLAAIDHVRTHADGYFVDPDAIIVMGFSAGGHLAACAGTLWDREELYRPLQKEPEAFRPDGVVLGYPVITSGPMSHRPSIQRLLGDRYEELVETVSLEKRVQPASPPMFLWHTADDTTVPVENSLLLEAALRANGVPVECRVYPHGLHGQSLADPTVYAPEQMWQMSPACAIWVERCAAWIFRTFGTGRLSAPKPAAGGSRP